MRLSEIVLISVYEPCLGPVVDDLGIAITGVVMSITVSDSAFGSFCFPSSHSSIAKGQHLVNDNTTYRPLHYTQNLMTMEWQIDKSKIICINVALTNPRPHHIKLTFLGTSLWSLRYSDACSTTLNASSASRL